MPVTEQEIRRLGDYVGATPAPADFDAFWSKRMAEADQVPLDFAVTPSEIPPFHTCEYLDLWFRGMGGAQLYAKYVKPRAARPVPLVLQFHGYPGASRSWLEQSSFAGMGCALLAMDCPGQGGTARTWAGSRAPPSPAISWRGWMGLWKRCTMSACIRISASSAGSCGSWWASTKARSLSTARPRGRIRPGLRRT